MDKLRQTLVNAMEIKGIKRSDVAKQVGISGSRVTEFLNDEQEIAFDTVLYMVNILVPEKVKDLMVEYSMQVEKPKTYSICHGVQQHSQKLGDSRVSSY